jgi:SAM-dependent methyltransferase
MPRHRLALVLDRARHLYPSSDFRRLRAALTAKTGIEIGGPSGVFQNANRWPLYAVIGHLDLLDFAPATIWTAASSGPPPPIGRRIVGEATAMAEVPPASYDFVFASHVLEHLANPIKGLAEWQRVLKPGGILVLVVPHRDATFDHRRAVTTMEHLRSDELSDVGEDDATHLDEILELHDLGRDPEAGDPASFAQRARSNLQHRALHHHVFLTQTLLTLVDAMRMDVIFLDHSLPHHICLAARTGTGTAQNSSYLASAAAWRRSSPFPSDRRQP